MRNSLFRPEELRRGFKLLLSDNRYREGIERDIRDFLENRRQLNESSNPIRIIRKLGEMMASRSYYRRAKVEPFRRKFDEIVRTYGPDFFWTEEGRRMLVDIIRQIAFRKGDAERWMLRLLEELKTKSLSEWTRNFYDNARRGEETEILGPKGRDNYLRDMGYFDRVPIDIHERRFIIRTGIYHLCSENLFDPLEIRDLQEALVKFSSRFLSGLSIQGVELSESPGIVDLIIWYHCAEPPDGFNVCGAKPMCLAATDGCPFFGACYFSIAKQCAR